MSNCFLDFLAQCFPFNFIHTGAVRIQCGQTPCCPKLAAHMGSMLHQWKNHQWFSVGFPYQTRKSWIWAVHIGPLGIYTLGWHWPYGFGLMWQTALAHSGLTIGATLASGLWSVSHQCATCQWPNEGCQWWANVGIPSFIHLHINLIYVYAQSVRVLSY